MVYHARKGDIIVHYRSSSGVVALSRAAEDAHEGATPIEEYGKGWWFRTRYRQFSIPISRNDVVRALAQLSDQNGPILAGGKIREAYFIPFSFLGLKRLRRVSRSTWPEWALAGKNRLGAA